ncbi:MAG: hypothetical protein KKA36_09585 [Gammaproteobacteria bacterium]|nr:hypothetical protein [Gammaproteobacteria bacterium]
MSKGDMPAKKRKLSLSLEAYRNALEIDADNKAARPKSEGIVVRISNDPNGLLDQTCSVSISP